jgi:23S rRNA (cytidine2498-2'-O)-methyltransferase
VTETAYLAADGFVEELVDELGEVTGVHGRLVLTDRPRQPAAWAADVWLNPTRLAIKSIADAQKQLRTRQAHWAHYSFQLHRRAELIAEPWRYLAVTSTRFPALPPREKIGGWTLLDERTLLAATDRTCPWPLGELQFVENHSAPPSRAYLKLWELFSRLGVMPGTGERCIDLGASPGGWTWVLAQLGARVVAVDKAPLAPGSRGASNAGRKARSV